MSTRSSIAILNPEGTVTGIYCHFDGYPSHNGKILLENYNAEEMVRRLLSYGDMSTLAPLVGEKHDFDKRPEGVCTFYHRDRGESDVWAKTHESVEAFDEWLSDTDREWSYLFADGAWVYAEIHGKHPYKYKKLTPKVVAKD